MTIAPNQSRLLTPPATPQATLPPESGAFSVAMERAHLSAPPPPSTHVTFQPLDKGPTLDPLDTRSFIAGIRHPADVAKPLKDLELTRPLQPTIDLNGRGGKTSTLSEHEQITRQAEKWVAQTFYGTMLKQMRESPFKSEIFDGGRGGQTFSSLFDQHLADRMAHAGSNKLVRKLVRKIEANKAYRMKQGDPTAALNGSTNAKAH